MYGHMGGSEIEIVSSFNYLGIVLSSGGTYLKAINTLAGKGLKVRNNTNYGNTFKYNV